jgi:hypothetical protein
MSDSEEKNISIITLNWIQFKSLDEFYTVQHPPEWGIRRNANFTDFVSPDQMGGVHIESFHNKNASDKICIDVLKRNPTSYVPQTKVKIKETGPIKEFSLEYCNSISKEYWKNKIIRTNQKVLLISAGTPLSQIHKFASIFDEIIKSIKIQVPVE